VAILQVLLTEVTHSVSNILKLLTVARRWTTEHLAVVITPNDYAAVVDGLERVLKEESCHVERVRTNWMLRLPVRVLTLFSGSEMGDLVASNLTTLRSDQISIIVYPSDVAISGKDADASHARSPHQVAPTRPTGLNRARVALYCG